MWVEHHNITEPAVVEHYTVALVCGTYKCLEDAKDLKMPPSIKEYIMTTRKRVNDITEMMRENNYHMQKMTINFPKDVDDNYYCRDEVFEHLKKIPEITLVSGPRAVGLGSALFEACAGRKGSRLRLRRRRE